MISRDRSAMDDPYALVDFYALIGYEQPEVKTEVRLIRRKKRLRKYSR